VTISGENVIATQSRVRLPLGPPLDASRIPRRSRALRRRRARPQKTPEMIRITPRNGNGMEMTFGGISARRRRLSSPKIAATSASLPVAVQQAHLPAALLATRLVALDSPSPEPHVVTVRTQAEARPRSLILPCRQLRVGRTTGPAHLPRRHKSLSSTDQRLIPTGGARAGPSEAPSSQDRRAGVRDVGQEAAGAQRG